MGVVSKLACTLESPEELQKNHSPRDHNLISLGYHLGFGIFKRSPGDSNGGQVWEPLLEEYKKY